MKRTPLRKISGRQAIKNREWAKVGEVRAEAIIEIYGYVLCERCGRRMVTWHNHHNVPRARGGGYIFVNSRLICFLCHIQVTDYPEDLKGLLETEKPL